jgi:iron complex outermembrane receptor protein
VVATQHLGTAAGVRLSAGGWQSTGFKEPAAPPLAASFGSPTAEPRYGSFNADGRWQATPWLLLSASGGYTDTHAGRALPVELVAVTSAHLNYYRMGAAANTPAGTVEADVYRNEEISTFAGAVDDVTTLIAQLSDIAKVTADNTVRAGFEFRNSAATANQGLLPGTISYDNIAVNGMWDWQIVPALELTNAARLDYLTLSHSGQLLGLPDRGAQNYDTTLTEPSFNSGLVIHVSDADTVRITAGRGLRLPSLFDFGAQAPVGRGIYIVGTPEAHPTAVWNAELGYVRTLDAIGASLETAVFFQRNTDLIAPEGSVPFQRLGKILASPTSNFGTSNEIGFEVGLRGATTGGFRWNASYRYASITQVLPNQVTRFDNGTPVHAIIVGAGYTQGRWEMDAAGRFQSAFTDYAKNGAGAVLPVAVPDYVVLNARVAYRLTDYLALAAVAQQFNVSPLLVAAGSYVDRRLTASATVQW